jgi:hypothetical protein
MTRKDISALIRHHPVLVLALEGPWRVALVELLVIPLLSIILSERSEKVAVPDFEFCGLQTVFDPLRP